MKKKCTVSGCKRLGRGNPPICNTCFEQGLHANAEKDGLRTLFEQIAGHPAVQDLLGKSADAMNQRFNDFMSKVASNLAQTIAGQRNQQKVQGEDPRVVMQFGKDETLTQEKIKQRLRDLAQFVHPDKGGSTEAMQRLNVAADVLMKEVK